MSYVDALEGKVLAIRKIEADVRSILKRIPNDTSVILEGMKTEKTILEIADCYYFSPDIVTIIEHVSNEFPLDAPMHRTWFTSHAGWYWIGPNNRLMAYVSRKANDGEVYNIRERVCAFMYHWDDVTESVFMSAYSMDHMEPTRGPCLIFAGIWNEGDTYYQFMDKVKKKEENVRRQGFENSLDGTLQIYWYRTGLRCALFFMASSLWMQQKIITINKSPKIKNRLIRRSGIKDPQVKIVMLRRREYIDEENKGTSIEWSCRWFVRGHWRLQPCKEGVRPIWIDTYIKGPEDKPLKEVPKTFAVVR